MTFAISVGRVIFDSLVIYFHTTIKLRLNSDLSATAWGKIIFTSIQQLDQVIGP